MKVYQKDPNAKLDYSFNWSSWLAGDTILESSWIVPAELKKVTETHDTTMATIWLRGGQLGQAYVVTNRIKTVGGREDDRSFTLKIVNR